MQELKTLTRDQDALIQMQTRLVNQLTACLKGFYPAALSLFSKLHQHSILIFLQTYPTPQAAQTASVQEIEAILRKGKHPTAKEAAARIVEVLHQPQLAADVVRILGSGSPQSGQTWSCAPGDGSDRIKWKEMVSPLVGS